MSPEETKRTVRAGSAMADTMAKTLFDIEPPISRYSIEKKLRLQICIFWEELKGYQESGRFSEASVEAQLEKLDQWIAGRLSGQNILFLVRLAEEAYPDWVRLMPRLLAARYEELRIARSWSALLNPEALNRLRTAIEIERANGDESGA